MSHQSESSWRRGSKAQNSLFRAGYSYSLKKAVQLFACYVHANVFQAVLLDNFQRCASSKVMDSVVHPHEWGSSRRQQFLHRGPSPGILHRPEQESHWFPSFHQHLLPTMSPRASQLKISKHWRKNPAEPTAILCQNQGLQKLQQNSGHLYTICGWCMVAFCIKVKSYVHTCNTLLSTLWSITLHIYFWDLLSFQKVPLIFETSISNVNTALEKGERG